jgi:hypothetical protein
MLQFKAWHNTQTTFTYLAVADCFLALFLHLANIASLFSFGQPIQRMFYFKSTHSSLQTAGLIPWHTMDFSILFMGENNRSPNQMLPKFHKTCTECMNSEWLGPTNEDFFHSFPGFLANAVAVRHPITQVNITHTGCILFNDHRFPAFLEVTFCRCNVHIREDINFSFVLPTQSP